jgi:hypothetical protein
MMCWDRIFDPPNISLFAVGNHLGRLATVINIDLQTLIFGRHKQPNPNCQSHQRGFVQEQYFELYCGLMEHIQLDFNWKTNGV